MKIVKGGVGGEIGGEPRDAVDVEKKVAHLLHLEALLSSQPEILGEKKHLERINDPHHESGFVGWRTRSQRDGRRNSGKKLKNGRYYHQLRQKSIHKLL